MNRQLDLIHMEELLTSADWVHIGKEHWRDPLNGAVYALDDAFDVQKEREAAHTTRMKRLNSRAGLWLAFLALAIFAGLAGFTISRMFPRKVTLNEASGWVVKQVPNSPEYILNIKARTLDAALLEVKVYSQEAWSPNDRLLAERITMLNVAKISVLTLRLDTEAFRNQLMTDIGGYSGHAVVYVEVTEAK